MTELEKLKSVKDCMDRLAEGVDPTSGEILSADTILNNVDLSRSFFYISDILRQVIENNGVVAKRTRKNRILSPFALPDDFYNKIEITEEPAMITQFTERINGLIDESVMRKLKVTTLTAWLVNNKLLCEETVNDRKRKKPTKAGVKIGISSEERDGRYGRYLAILYNESAQRHIVNNLEQITAILNDEKA